MLRLLRHHYPFRSFALLFGEALAILAALVAGVLLRLGSLEPILHTPFVFAARAGVVIVVCLVVLFLNDLYEFELADTKVSLLTRTLRALGLAFVILALVYYLVPALLLGRGVFALAFTLMTLVIFGWRLLYLWLIMGRAPRRNVLVVGCEDLAVDIAKEVLRHKGAGVRVVGFLTGDPSRVGERLLNPCIIGTYDEVCRLVKEHQVDQIIVALKERRGFPVEELLACRMMGVRVVDGIGFFERLTGKMMVESLKPSNLIFAGFNETWTSLLAKRLLDMVAAATLLLVFGPLMLVAAVLIKLDSRGLVLFRQERVGERGHPFSICKFRSMNEDAEGQSGPVWASEDDPRITRVGRWLRKFRIDELPQLWNVLTGDMSLVGPRPERPYFVRQLTKHIPYYGQRAAVKPGITGWAQVRYAYGSSEEDSLEKLKYDLYYVKNYTVWLDLLILFETVKIVLFGRGSR